MMKIAVVILNYKNCVDTLACAQSVLRSTIPPQLLVIVDNDSPGNDYEQLKQWVSGYNDNGVRFHASSQSACAGITANTAQWACFSSDNLKLFILKSIKNGGYAAGNNIGIKLAMATGMDGVWVLNNDTEVEPQALAAMKKALFADLTAGLCGSLLVYTDDGLVQCRAGGYCNPWTALSVLNGQGLTIEQALQTPAHAVVEQINFIYGASVMASRAFIEQVGLMHEGFFMYCEEQDWAWRGKGRFRLTYAPEAIVRHKEGATSGWSKRKFNARMMWLLTRSRILLIARHAPYALPVLFFSLGYALVRMLWHRLKITIVLL